MTKKPIGTILDKANRILHLILLAIVVILLKVWYLSIIKHEEKVVEARKPRQKTVMETTTRATIRDRFNIPLAINKVKYQAAILYSPIREIPAISWEKDGNGALVKHLKRKEYISELAELLGKELSLDPTRIEDLIHSKASLYFHLPFILKEELTEKEFYRLKFLEKDYPGLMVLMVPKRVYPFGSIGADVIGYMGAINKEEYENILQEVKELKKYLKSNEENENPEPPFGYSSANEVRKRLKELERRAYTINDMIGKSGIEAAFEEELRGYKGEKKYYTDAHGNCLKEFPIGHPPQSGQRLLLSISEELQEYIETLLIQSEALRKESQSNWIKGGAIVVMDPKEGDILAMASYPRHDPNDFIPSGNSSLNIEKKQRILKWFETESYISELWNQQIPLERELYDPEKQEIFTDTLWLTWENYLDRILPLDHPVRLELDKIVTIEDAFDVLNTMNSLLSLVPTSNVKLLLKVLFDPEQSAFAVRQEEEIAQAIRENQTLLQQLKAKLNEKFGNLKTNYDRLLFLDLCRLSVDPNRFPENLLQKIGQKKLSSYRKATSCKIAMEEVVKTMSFSLFHDLFFLPWKEKEGKNFIAEKRAEEKRLKTYARPFIEYLDREEKEKFQQFLVENKDTFLTAFLLGKPGNNPKLIPYVEHFLLWHQELSQGAHQSIEWWESYKTLQKALDGLQEEEAKSYLHSMRSYQDLNQHLWGKYRNLRSENEIQLEKHLAGAFYPMYGFGFGRSYAFRQAASQGSIFKIVTAYTALMQRDLNPLTVIDRIYHRGGTLYLGETLDGRAIPRMYRGGRLPKSLSPNIGKIDIVKAIETSSNLYFSLLAGDILDSPWDLATSAELFSYGSKTGIDLPGEISGMIPKDLEENKTGLYSFAIGQHTLVVTPLQAAVMLSTIANGGEVLKPKIVSMKAGRDCDFSSILFDPKDPFPFQESLSLVGIDFPLFTATINPKTTQKVTSIPKEVIRTISLPKEVRKTLLKGMEQVIKKISTDLVWSLASHYKDYPEAIQSLKNCSNILVGKSSSAEYMEPVHLDGESGVQKSTHIWFGGISFEDELKEKPELVIVIYLRFGGHGKDAAPLAAQIVEKWHQIKQNYTQTVF